jgi:hypothetical protein
MVVARRDRRHHRGVDHAQPLEPDHAQPLVDHRHGIARAPHLGGADGVKDRAADVAGRLDQRRLAVADGAARKIFDRLVARERGLRHDPAREADGIRRHAAIFVGGQVYWASTVGRRAR